MPLKSLRLLGFFGGVGFFRFFGFCFVFSKKTKHSSIWIPIIVIRSLLQGETVAQKDYLGLVQDTKEC